MPAHPIAQLLLWLAQSPHTGASETSLEIVHLSGHVCVPLPSVFWKKYGERRVENGEVRGAVTGKDSLDSLVPHEWYLSAIWSYTGLIPRADEPITRAAGMWD